MSLLSILLLVVGLIYSAHSQSNINIIICVYKQYGLGRGAVRLVRNGTFSSSYSAGIVQIYYFTSTSSANRWGNICDDSSLGSTEANVICNQLGYNGASNHGSAGSTSK